MLLKQLFEYSIEYLIKYLSTELEYSLHLYSPMKYRTVNCEYWVDAITLVAYLMYRQIESCILNSVIGFVGRLYANTILSKV